MHSESPDDRPKKKGIPYEYRSLAPFLTLGIHLAVTVVVFFFIGYWIDNKFGISPTGKLVGLLLGCLGGFYKFFKTTTSLINQEEKQRTNNKHEN
jgi:F0F1-type ATP synthase assembly protein I